MAYNGVTLAFSYEAHLPSISGSRISDLFTPFARSPGSPPMLKI